MDENTQEETTVMNEPIIKKPNDFRFKVELAMFTFFVAKTLSDTVIVNLLERNTCLVVLNLSADNCTEPVTPDIEGLVQERVVDVAMARSMIEAFVASVLSLFIGPWSDTNGRRPLMLLSLMGYTSSAVVWCVLSLMPGLHPLYFLFTCIPVALSGGYVSYFLAVFCYISDTTESSKRAWRMGLVEGACLLGVMVSSLITPYIQGLSAQYGYTTVFATSALLQFLILVFTYFCVNESVTIVESERSKLLRLDHVKDVFTTCFRSRPNHIRTIVMFIIITIVIFVIVLDGELSVLYLFTQKKFNWTLIEYTRLTSYSLLLAGAGVCSTWLFVAVFKLSELPLVFFVTLCSIIKSAILAMASSSLYLYVACTLNALTVLTTPLARSKLSKLIPTEDLGKIFAFTSFLEATAPLTASPLYTFVYKATLNTLPNAVFWLSTGLCCISATVIGSALALHRLASPSTQGFVPIQNNDDSRRPSVQE